MRTLKSAFLRAFVPSIARYLRQQGTSFGKVFLWNRVVTPHVSWRDFALRAETLCGHGVSGTINDTIFSRVYFFGTWEPAITAHITSTLKPGDTVIDVGANIGVHAMLAAKCVGPSGVVHAIEASPTIFASLQRNLAENGISNVIAHNVAIVDARRPVTIYRHNETNLGASTIMKHRVLEEGGEAFVEECSVQGLPLDEAVGDAALRAARLIKIDVEGAEVEVLTGILRNAHVLRPDVELIVECNPDSLAVAGLDRPRFLALLAEHGFEPFELPNTHSVRDYVDPAGLAPRPLVWNEDRPVDVVFRRQS